MGSREGSGRSAAHWSGRDLIGVLVGAVAALGIIALWAVDLALEVRVPASVALLIVVIVGYLTAGTRLSVALGAFERGQAQTLGRMLLTAGLSGVPLLATSAGLMWMYMWVGKLPRRYLGPMRGRGCKSHRRSATRLAAMLRQYCGGRLGRRPVYAALLPDLAGDDGGLLSPEYRIRPGLRTLVGLAGNGLGGVLWLAAALPARTVPHVGATAGQGFGYNFGRVIAAVGRLRWAICSRPLAGITREPAPWSRVCLFGIVLIAIAPETRGQPLSE